MPSLGITWDERKACAATGLPGARSLSREQPSQKWTAVSAPPPWRASKIKPDGAGFPAIRRSSAGCACPPPPT
eukprot:scaffold25664_cov119-Isochrysis_galbana.AAC.4